MRTPNFENLLKVLHREVPDRPTLFEFFLNDRLYEKLAGPEICAMTDPLAHFRKLLHAYMNAGYDYVTVQGSDFHFTTRERAHDKTLSLNDGFVITDRASFESYAWPNPEDYDYTRLEKLAVELPEGMKLIVWGPGGVLENVISLTGFENLCIMIYEEPELVQDIFNAVGSRFIKYYELCAPFNTVGALISNDDWGYKSQTMLSPADMRKYVFPWHKKIVETIHASGKPAILHSCGFAEEIMDDMIDDMKYDAKHSYEDIIMPVEEAYERWGHRIAILGGMDVDFVIRSLEEDIKTRCKAMLKRVEARGGYALGTGNSVPYYVPDEKYFAMISVIQEG
jgi:uroporphyrinogen decarboxylase